MDDCGAIGSGKELVNLSKSVDVKYCVTGLGEVRWVLSRLSSPPMKRLVVCPSHSAISNLERNATFPVIL